MRPHRRQPTRLPRPWDSPGKNTGVGCHFLLQCMKVKVKLKLLSHVWLLVTAWTAAYQAPLFKGFSRQECWSGLPLSPPGDLSDPGIKPTSPVSPALAGRSFTIEPSGKLLWYKTWSETMSGKVKSPFLKGLKPQVRLLYTRSQWCSSRFIEAIMKMFIMKILRRPHTVWNPWGNQ